MHGEGLVSASAAQCAEELTRMFTDPGIRAVVPPWGGGELALELFPHLDMAAIALSDPTGFVGYSDISTLLLPLTAMTGIATLHGQNLMETPYRVPDPLGSWLDVAAQPAGASVIHGPSEFHRSGGFDS